HHCKRHGKHSRKHFSLLISYSRDHLAKRTDSPHHAALSEGTIGRRDTGTNRRNPQPDRGENSHPENPRRLAVRSGHIAPVVASVKAHREAIEELRTETSDTPAGQENYRADQARLSRNLRAATYSFAGTFWMFLRSISDNFAEAARI